MSVSLAAIAGHLRERGYVARVEGEADCCVEDVRRDSRAVASGDLFAVISGASTDGARFVPAARDRGAVALLVDREGIEPSMPTLVVDDVRAVLGEVSQFVHGGAGNKLAVVGVTGTNGKTTVTFVVEQALRSLGHAPASIGTVAARLAGKSIASSFTTPEADDLARFCSAAVAEDSSHLIMEVSSHGIAQGRVQGLTFAVAAFTNLSQDHLDFHGTMEAYGAVKESFLQSANSKLAVVHVGDAFGRAVAERLVLAGRPTLAVRVAPAAESAGARNLLVTVLSSRTTGLELRCDFEGSSATFTSPLIGDVNAENLGVALGILLGLGHPLELCCEALSSAAPAPGRFERVGGGEVAVVVDYAHTPDALERALKTLRSVATGRLLVVFGCGGDRDRDKRPKMGSAAARLADWVIVTSDNPRSESPYGIIEEILHGIPAEQRGNVMVESDRAIAIRKAIRMSAAGDTVLVAGKGHEPYQIIGAVTHDFDDREVCRKVLRELEAERGN